MKIADYQRSGAAGRAAKRQARKAAAAAMSKRMMTREHGSVADQRALWSSWDYNPNTGPKHLNKGYTARPSSNAQQYRRNPMMYGMQ